MLEILLILLGMGTPTQAPTTVTNDQTQETTIGTTTPTDDTGGETIHIPVKK